MKNITKESLRKQFDEETEFHHIECNCSEYANWVEEKLVKLFAIPDVSGSLPSEEEIREPMQNALYATGNFSTDECTKISIGILEYLKDAGFKVVRQ